MEEKELQRELIIKKFAEVAATEESNITTILRMIHPSCWSAIVADCAIIRESGVVHSNCTNAEHHDIRWDVDLRISQYRPYDDGAVVPFSLAVFYDSGGLGDRKTINLSDPLFTEKLMSKLWTVYSDDTAKALFDDLTKCIALIRDELYKHIYNTFWLKRGADSAYLFVKACQALEKRDELKKRLANVDSKCRHACTELKDISKALYDTRKFTKSGALQSVRARVDKLENFLSPAV